MRVLAALAMMMASLVAVPAQAQKQSQVEPKFSTPAKAAQVLEANIADRLPRRPSPTRRISGCSTCRPAAG